MHSRWCRLYVKKKKKEKNTHKIFSNRHFKIRLEKCVLPQSGNCCCSAHTGLTVWGCSDNPDNTEMRLVSRHFLLPSPWQNAVFCCISGNKFWRLQWMGKWSLLGSIPALNAAFPLVWFSRSCVLQCYNNSVNRIWLLDTVVVVMLLMS